MFEKISVSVSANGCAYTVEQQESVLKQSQYSKRTED
jgi:hypothetical protein